MTYIHSKPPTEHQEQTGFINWFHLKYPSVLIYAIPNGEKRSISVAKRLKKEGVVRGIPDLHIPEWDLYIEMKRQKGGRLSDAQKKIIEYLEFAGKKVIVAKGAEDASRQVVEYLFSK